MNMEYQMILVKVEDQVATVTLNRPEVGNAFDVTSYGEVTEAFQRLGQDPDVGSIVITGAGKNFSTGGDIKGFRRAIDEGRYLAKERVILPGKMSAAIRRCPKPTIVMVNGVAAGAGAGVALACDFRIMATNSKLILAFINLGLTGDSCSMYYLTRMVGAAKAMELMMLGEPIQAAQANALNLAYKVVEPENLEEETYHFAKRLAHGPSVGYALQKEMINQRFFSDLDSWMDLEAENMAKASRTNDFSEAVNAFLEKRRPSFGGK